MAPSLRHFYHVWAGGRYQDAVAEHGEALRAARLRAVPEVGIVGTAGEVRTCRRFLDEHLPGYQVVAAAQAGFEQVTLAALHEAACGAERGTAFLYAHTKGAMSASAHSAVWRREMTDVTVRLWEDCTFALFTVDAAGCRWIAERRIFAGNFWWARAGYLASLPAGSWQPTAVQRAKCAMGHCLHPGPAGNHDRLAAEDWIGTGPVTVADLLPGMPCTRMVTIRMLQHVSGGRAGGTEWPAPGGTAEVTELEAMNLCRSDGVHAPPVAEYVT